MNAKAKQKRIATIRAWQKANADRVKSIRRAYYLKHKTKAVKQSAKAYEYLKECEKQLMIVLDL